MPVGADRNNRIEICGPLTDLGHKHRLGVLACAPAR